MKITSHDRAVAETVETLTHTVEMAADGRSDPVLAARALSQAQTEVAEKSRLAIEVLDRAKTKGRHRVALMAQRLANELADCQKQLAALGQRLTGKKSRLSFDYGPSFTAHHEFTVRPDTTGRPRV